MTTSMFKHFGPRLPVISARWSTDNVVAYSSNDYKATSFCNRTLRYLPRPIANTIFTGYEIQKKAC